MVARVLLQQPALYLPQEAAAAQGPESEGVLHMLPVSSRAAKVLRLLLDVLLRELLLYLLLLRAG